MTSAIVLPRLSAWTEGHVQALFTAKTEADFESAFDVFLAKNVSVTVNGAHITRDAYKQRLQADRALERSATVTFGGVVQVDKEHSDDFKSSMVLLFRNKSLHRSMSCQSCPFSAAAYLNPTLHPPTLPGRGFFDGRRVFKLDEVTTTGGVA
ncbi:hypothetical protein C8J56DRAFT_963487 [Mycena floridula]|nr:hypothetical protein C8J56DRAFT_963487 [Mycena floridula]